MLYAHAGSHRRQRAWGEASDSARRSEGLLGGTVRLVEGRLTAPRRNRARDRTTQLGWVSVSTGAVTVVKSLGWRKVTTSRRLSLSPDNRFSRVLGDGCESGEATAHAGGALTAAIEHIYVLSADGREEVELTTSAHDEQPAWSADGQHLLFISNRTGSRDLWAAADARRKGRRSAHDGPAGHRPNREHGDHRGQRAALCHSVEAVRRSRGCRDRHDGRAARNRSHDPAFRRRSPVVVTGWTLLSSRGPVQRQRRPGPM